MMPADGREGVARAVVTRGIDDVGIAHLPPVDSTLYSALLEMLGDRPTVNAKVVGEIGERPAGLGSR